jgi:hypothetical protein
MPASSPALLFDKVPENPFSPTHSSSKEPVTTKALPPSKPDGTFVLKVLYVFAGAKRRSDVHECLLQLQQQFGFILFMQEIDLLRGQDVSDQQYWAEVQRSVDAGEWHVLIITPPCHTHSRARHSDSSGPKPVRSAQWPWGFPWLSNKDSKICEMANSFVLQSIDLCHRASAVATLYMLEHPEDLGITPSGQKPASIWQLPEIHELLIATHACTWAIFQCTVGAETASLLVCSPL